MLYKNTHEKTGYLSSASKLSISCDRDCNCNLTETLHDSMYFWAIPRNDAKKLQFFCICDKTLEIFHFITTPHNGTTIIGEVRKPMIES